MFMAGLAMAGVLAACGGEDQPPPVVPLSIGQPTQGAIVPPTFTVKVAVQEFAVVEPPGEAQEGTGHLHILIDTDFIPVGEGIPEDDQHIHIHDGSAEAEITLTPGPHVLRAQFADGADRALEGRDQENAAKLVVAVESDAPAQSLRFVSPTDGAVVPPTLDVIMAATGLMVEPPGEAQEDRGHFHILVDVDFTPAGQVIPSPEGDSRYVHVQSGGRRAPLSLSPGPHTLRLQFADGLDTALSGDQYRDEINVNVRFGQGARQVMFVEPTDGATVSERFTVTMATVGIAIEPESSEAISRVDLPLIPGLTRDGAGHLHILINEDFVTEVIPSDETHIHLDGGQLSTQLTLEPGEYTLRLQLAGHDKKALAGNEFRDEIRITVE
jgi:hypothetical protein